MLNKKCGYVKSFNGYHEIILSDGKEYLFFHHDIDSIEKIKVDDKVEFFEKVIEDERGITYIAYCISKEKSL